MYNPNAYGARARIEARRNRKISAIVALAIFFASIGTVCHMDYQDQQAKTQGPLAYSTK